MIRTCCTPDYNWVFNVEDGHFLRWGRTKEDDPQFSPLGPEILDIEVSTICHGVSGPCKHCYKSNTGTGKNMSFETFKTILDKMPENLTQIAFGIGDIDGNPDLFKMFEYSRQKGVVPNLTINGARMIPEYYDKLSHLCGAVAVSRYEPKDVCYDAVKQLTDRGMEQINIHMMVSEETYPQCIELIQDCKKDERLKKLNAIVFLMMKPKGERNTYHQLSSIDKFKNIIDKSFEEGINIGFDSCSAPAFLQCVDGHERYEEFRMCAESCESSCFSSYINVDGYYWHCSFAEGVSPWKGINVMSCEDFLKDVWFSEEVCCFRDKILKTADKDIRKCPVYNLNIN